MTKKICGLLFALLAFCLVSCDSDNTEPIVLGDIEDNFLSLIYPRESSYQIFISGGDGNYSAECSNKEILATEMTSDKGFNCLEILPLSTGEATVTVKDQSNNAYVLHVSVEYLSHYIEIRKLEVSVTGGNLTINEQNAIRESALASVPVKVNGGYKFVYSDAGQTHGEVYVYPEQLGGKSEKGVFTRTIIRENGVLAEYQITLPDNKVYHFDLVPVQLNALKSSGVFPHQFIEDLTEKYKPEYPHVETVYTSQVIK